MGYRKGREGVRRRKGEVEEERIRVKEGWNRGGRGIWIERRKEMVGIGKEERNPKRK